MGKIFGNGIDQSDLVTLLTLINTNFAGINAKLDADTGVTDANYASLYDISFPSTTIQSAGIRSQGDIITFLNSFLTNFNLVLTKLDSDGGVADTNYNALWVITDVIDNTAAGNIYQDGLNQSQLVNLLQTIITNIAGANAKLDADGTVADTDYAATWDVSDTVDNSGCND